LVGLEKKNFLIRFPLNVIHLWQGKILLPNKIHLRWSRGLTFWPMDSGRKKGPTLFFEKLATSIDGHLLKPELIPPPISPPLFSEVFFYFWTCSCSWQIDGESFWVRGQTTSVVELRRWSQNTLTHTHVRKLFSFFAFYLSFSPPFYILKISLLLI